MNDHPEVTSGPTPEGVRRLFEQWLEEDAEAVAEAMILDAQTDREDDEAFDDDEFERLKADAYARAGLLETAADPDAAPVAPKALTVIAGGAGASGTRRSCGPRRSAAYGQRSNQTQALALGRIGQRCSAMPHRLHMGTSAADNGFVLDLESSRAWLDDHGLAWVGSKLFFLPVSQGAIVRVTTRASVADIRQSKLVIDMEDGRGQHRQMHLDSSQHESVLDLEEHDVRLADWGFSLNADARTE